MKSRYILIFNEATHNAAENNRIALFVEKIKAQTTFRMKTNNNCPFEVGPAEFKPILTLLFAHHLFAFTWMQLRNANLEKSRIYALPFTIQNPCTYALICL